MKYILPALAVFLAACGTEQPKDPLIDVRIVAVESTLTISEAKIQNLNDRPMTYSVRCTGQASNGTLYQVFGEIVTIPPLQTETTWDGRNTEGQKVTNIKCSSKTH